ncbi:Mettl5 [Symbiodinium sp. CCMP2456]|nr:Mettl5 [Symbiodinium sp. CCMP2456]
MDEGVVDLGAGNGILGIGALLLGAPRAVFVEVDPAAADAIEEGLEAQSLSARSRVLRCDVEEVADDSDCVCDLVLMNPPWGQQRKSADRPFLQASIALAKTSVHMMHSAGAIHVEPWARDHGWKAVRWPETQGSVSAVSWLTSMAGRWARRLIWSCHRPIQMFRITLL